MTPRVRVIKLGGSLLGWNGLVPAFNNWLALQTKAVNVVVVGGGDLVDALRELDRRHTLDPTEAHWLCVRAMSLTAQSLVSMLGDATLVSRLEELRLSETSVQVFDALSFLRQDTGSTEALPCNWDVTSDSIAARVATALRARELVLLKSALPAAPATREAWSHSGFVDAYFLRASRSLSVRAVDLRSVDFDQLTFGLAHGSKVESGPLAE